MIIVYCTFPNIKEARSMAQNLLSKKLIACANFVSSESMYDWKGKLETKSEIIAFMKANTSYWHTIQEEISSTHSYAVPAIIKMEVEAHKAYEDWVNSII